MLTDAGCRACGQSLTVHQRAKGDYCDDQKCLHEKVQHEIDAGKKRLRRRQLYQANKARTAAGVKKQVAVTILPVNAGSLVPQDADRRQLFIDHFREQAHGTVPPSEIQSSQENPELEPADKVLGEACATCRGFCCRSAGTKAFIDSATIGRVMIDKRERDLEELLSVYLSRMPETIWSDSCVFHGERGCALPRDMRSKICNTYLCDELKRSRRRLQNEPAAPLFAVAMREDVVHFHKTINKKNSSRSHSGELSPSEGRSGDTH